MLNRRPPPKRQPPHHRRPRALCSLRGEAAESVENTEAPESVNEIKQCPVAHSQTCSRSSPVPNAEVPEYLKQTDLYMPGTKTSNINTSSGVNKSSFLSSDFTSTASCILFQSWSSFVFGFRPASVPHWRGDCLNSRGEV